MLGFYLFKPVNVNAPVPGNLLFVHERGSTCEPNLKAAMPVAYQDYYETLGVSRSASQSEITKAFRKLARRYHPDVCKEKGAEDKFKKINEAYEVLQDPEKRKRYDTLGAGWKDGQSFTPPPGWEEMLNFGRRGGQRRGGEFSFDFGGSGGGFSDFFNSIFGSAGSAAGFEQFTAGRASQGANKRSRGAHELRAELPITLAEIYHSGTKKVTLQFADSTSGSTARTVTKTYSVKIPPGTADGSVIRLAGQGPGGGNLMLTVRLAPDPRFTVSNADLICEVPVAPWEAALGGKINVSTMEGEIALNVPAGAQSEQKFRIKGRGLLQRDGSRGDLLVKLKVVMPASLNNEERELFRKLATVTNFRPRE